MQHIQELLQKYNTTDTLNFVMKKNYKSYKEKDLYQYIKKNMPSIMFTRLENFSVQGTPDILAYNNKHHFFTIENKVSQRNSVRLSSHQISFHFRHPHNSFILVKAIAPSCLKLYEGRQIQSLVASGLRLKPLAEGLADCLKVFEEV